MSQKIEGTFSLREIANITHHSKYKNRYDYAKRDVIKKVVVIKQTELHPDGKGRPSITYIFKSFSYPQYAPYNSKTKYSKQRKTKHQYDHYLSISTEDGSFSVDSVNWKYRLGSQKRWIDNPPQSSVKTIYRETAEKWKQQYDKEVAVIKAKYKGEELKKKLKLAKVDYDKKKIDHRKKAKYLDGGDYNSQVNGLNGDFYFRCINTYQYFGHLYGKNTNPDGEVDKVYMFMPKHLIALVDFLIKANLIKQ